MTDRPRFSDFALPGSASICRLLLPLRTVDGRALSWAAVAQAYGRAEGVDGYVDFHRLVEWPGDGSSEPRPQVGHPAGLLDPATADRLTEALSGFGCSAIWRTGSRGESPLAELAASWCRRPFEGPVTSADVRVRIDAPAYADSLVLSGPAGLCSTLSSAGLETFRVAGSAHGSITTD